MKSKFVILEIVLIVLILGSVLLGAYVTGYERLKWLNYVLVGASAANLFFIFREEQEKHNNRRR